MLYNIRDLFTDEMCNLPGTDLVTHTIDTADAPPSFDSDHTVDMCILPYRHSLEARKELDKNRQKSNTYLTLISLRNQTALGKSSGAREIEKNNTHRLCVNMR